MWICVYCETENPDSSTSCVCCGQVRLEKKNIADIREKELSGKKVSTGEKEPVMEKTGKQKKESMILLFGAAALVCLLIIGYFTIHRWTSANCTTPEICSICGKTRRPALGHDWTPATCTEPQQCKVCGAIGQSALGHLWQEATYNTPKTCSRCGIKAENVKGYLGAVPGDWGEETIYVRGSQSSHPFEFTQVLEDCFRVTMELEVTEYSGAPFGTWYLYARDLNGKWSHIAEFEIEESKKDQTQTYFFEFDPVTFDAFTIVMKGDSNYSLSYRLSFDDFQVLEE